MNAPMTPEQRKAIAHQLGDAQPATDGLLGSLAESVANVRGHDHPKWEDLYCMNLTSYMGERMAPVLRRLLDAEAEWVAFRDQRNAVFETNKELLERVEQSGLARIQAENETRTMVRERDALRARVAELEAARDGERRTGYQRAIDVMRQERLSMSVGLLEAQFELDALDADEGSHGPVSFTELTVGNRIRFVTADNGFGGMGEVWRTGTITRITAKTIAVDCDENLLGDTAVLRDAEWSARAVHRAPAAVSVESPWERAVAGLNALVDADVIFHVEPDGHISAPFSDEHIEWDLKARRWVLTHDDEDESAPAPVEDLHDSPLYHAYETGRDLPRRPGACDACGDVPEKWCPDCAACRQGCHGGHDNNPCTHPRAPWGGAL